MALLIDRFIQSTWKGNKISKFPRQCSINSTRRGNDTGSNPWQLTCLSPYMVVELGVMKVKFCLRRSSPFFYRQWRVLHPRAQTESYCRGKAGRIKGS